MENNIFTIVSSSSSNVQKSPYGDFSKDALALDDTPSDLITESLSQEEVIGRLHDYLTKLDKKPSYQTTNAKGDIKGELEQIEHLIEELEEEESTDPSTLRYASKEGEMLYHKAIKKLTEASQEPARSPKFKKTASMRRFLAETPSASQLQPHVNAQLWHV